MFNFQGTGIKIVLAITLVLSVFGVFKYQSSKILIKVIHNFWGYAIGQTVYNLGLHG